jgi:antitoxin (DNA-binding transcriptional repressor) of toxin-antitoxin stability system
MKKKVQVEEIQNNFRQYLKVVLKGSDVIIMDKQKAIAKLVRIAGEKSNSQEDKWTSDDFDIQLSE